MSVKPDAEIGFLEHVEQARHRPAFKHPGFECGEIRRFRLNLQGRQ
jgi:hypothetical protein